MRTREKRKPVRLPATMRSDVGSSDVHINDVSGRGMMLTRTDAPPPPAGSYLEVRRGTIAVVARIVWRQGRKFGVRAQDSIDVQDLIAAKPLPALDAETTGEKKARHRIAHGEVAARSRHFARLFQYLILLVAVGAGAVALAGSVTHALAPLRYIEASLIGGRVP